MDIRLKHDSPAEYRVKAVLRDLLETRDLAPWTWTDEVLIDERAIPHSHPVLTLHTRHTDPDRLLATYLHEQLHWHAEAHSAQRDEFVAATHDAYPRVPATPPEGARDAESTREHLLICHLEQCALERLLGAEPAGRLIGWLADDHYRWVYRTVIADRATLTALTRTHDLMPAALN
jgi:hypothetical protein